MFNPRAHRTSRLAAATLVAAALAHASHAEQPADGAPPAATTPAPHAEVTKDRLLALLKELPTQRAANAGADNTAGLIATEELLLKKLRDYGFTPTTHDIDFLGSSRDQRDNPDRKPWRNIIVDIPGTTRPDEILVFSAHFDAVHKAPGADDDGTGVVAILEMARLLKDRPMQRTVRLCLFNLEEVGLVGSRAYVQSIENDIKGEPILDAEGKPTAERHPPMRKYLGMASIDGVGYFTDEPNSQKSPIPETKFFKPPTVGDFLAMGGILRGRHFSQALKKEMESAAPKLKLVVVDWLPIALPDLLRSDHAPFIGAGVPAVILADTANFRSPHYHKPTDTIETLDMDRYTEVVRALVGAAYALGGPVGGPLIDLTPPSAAPSKPTARDESPTIPTTTTPNDKPGPRP